MENTHICRHFANLGSRSLGQDTCQVSTYRRSTMQGLVARGITLEEIWSVDVNYVKSHCSQNIGQGHQVKVSAKSVH